MRSVAALLLLALAGCYATPARHQGAVWVATTAGGITYRVVDIGRDYAGELVVDGRAYSLAGAHHEKGVFTGHAVIDGKRWEVRLEHTGDGTDEAGEWVDARDAVRGGVLRFRRE